MNKSILVIDKPRVCSECDLFKNYYDEEHEEWNYACAITEQIIDIDEAEEHRHKDCPLKELPKKKINEEVCIDSRGEYYVKIIKPTEYVKGYNACIDEILGKEK